ncbi:MAG: sodium:solute symporter family protein [Vicinamibacterales bacterium]
MNPLLVILGYTALMFGLGLYLSRRVRATDDFFVAGRALGPGLLATTLLASNIGAGSTVGAAGLGYRDGLAGWWWVGSAALGSFVLAWWVGPAIRRVAARHGLRTVGDYLEWRYDQRVRVVLGVLLWLGALAILSGQLIAMSWILSTVAGTPKWLGCVLGGALVSVYFAAGGLFSSVRLNVLQLGVKLGGFALALPLALAAIGGWSTLRGLPPPSPSFWNPWQSGASGWMYIAMLAPAFVISPGLLQKVYGARDDRAVRWGVGINAVGLLLYAVVPVLLGMIARHRFPDLASPELALPALLADGLPPLVGALGLAAVFSAELSAADAVLFMLTTSLAQDLYKRFLDPVASDATVLRVSRITALVAGALGIGFAIVFPTVIGSLSIFYTLLSVGLFVPIFGGLFVPGATSVDALASIAGGLVCFVAVHLLTGGAGVAGLTPAVAGLTAAAVCFTGSLAFARRRGRTMAEPRTEAR